MNDQETYDTILSLVEKNSDDLIFAERMATLAVTLGLEHGQGCDGCDREMDEEVMGVAGFRFVRAFDSNGDPDVIVCPVCIAERDAYEVSVEGV